MKPHFLGAAQSLNHVQLFVAPWAAACQAPLSTEFFRQEYWSGLPLPTPGTLLEFSLIFLLKEYMRPTANFLLATLSISLNHPKLETQVLWDLRPL